MPIYDYRCSECGRRFELIIASIESKPAEACPQCGSVDIVRMISRFRVVKSLESRLESLADPAALGDIDENNPESMLRWAKKLNRAVGDDLGEDLEGIMEEELSRPGEPLSGRGV